MHPEENRLNTFPAFLELAQTIVNIVPHMYSLLPVPEGACRPEPFHRAQSFISATSLFRNKTPQLLLVSLIGSLHLLCRCGQRILSRSETLVTNMS
jgi:hypothetical protein